MMDRGQSISSKSKKYIRISTQTSLASYQALKTCGAHLDEKTQAKIADFTFNLMISLMEKHRKIYTLSVGETGVYQDTSTRRIAHFIALAQDNGINPGSISESSCYVTHKHFLEIQARFKSVWDDVDKSLNSRGGK